jgi:radical SAM superfamily enzyme YgiQ (UPF0313 family)
MSPTGPSLLLVNPWVDDFAAYDYFARPLGLLHLAGLLEDRGFQVHLLDCLGVPHARPGPFGTGRYPKKILPTPAALQGITRRYGRYGLSEAAFRERLSRVPEPAAVLVTSLMTYWYPGVSAAISLVKERFPRAPVMLGGIYATLCPDHARRHSGADFFVRGGGEAAVLSQLSALGLIGEAEAVPEDLDRLPYPALHLAAHLNFIPLLTSRGCPLNCDYCASHLLEPRYRRRRPLTVVAELVHWQARLGLREVAFYDDALLVDPESHLLIILEELARRGQNFRFHTPNGLHARFLTREVARWLQRSNFATLRLGVETTALGEARSDRKLQAGELEAALAYLREAGFRREQLGVYLLLGLPGQEEGELETSIRQIKALGATPILAQYSPIPGTALWPQAVQCSRYDLESEPLCQNNSLFPCWPRLSWERYTRLKRLAEG